jgi:hypothetical protein
MLTIKQMSWAEKLQAMEELWESLSRDEDRLESPTWHAAVLEETPHNCAAGHKAPNCRKSLPRARRGKTTPCFRRFVMTPSRPALNLALRRSRGGG